MDVVDVGRSRDAVDWAFVVDREPRRRCDRHYRRLERAVLESYIGETAREIFRMARVFVTGSADGLGKMAAELLIEQGHKVVLHARSAARAEETRKKVGGAEHIVVGDLSNIAETKSVADQVNRLGRFDAVIHNAGIGYREPKLVKTVDGLPQLFAVNTLAPYLLTALITMPKRLVYLSSGMHYGAGSHLDDMLWEKRRWNGSQAYAETKFQDVLLAFAVARLFPEVKSNSLEPGWVPTKMGGAGAPDDIDKAHRTQVWLATSDQPAAAVSGRYFFHQKLRDPDPATKDVERQDLLLDLCRKVSGIALSAT
jgi:NAD(P)-dependent dehydrogenase (short-subunit alcohol dehydrogenase family)